MSSYFPSFEVEKYAAVGHTALRILTKTQGYDGQNIEGEVQWLHFSLIIHFLLNMGRRTGMHTVNYVQRYQSNCSKLGRVYTNHPTKGLHLDNSSATHWEVSCAKPNTGSSLSMSCLLGGAVFVSTYAMMRDYVCLVVRYSRLLMRWRGTYK